MYLQLRVEGFLWSEKVPIYAGKSSVKSVSEIPLTDSSGNSVSIHLYSPEDEIGTKKFMLYTKACIVNETAYDLKYYTPGDKQTVAIPGQTQIDPTDAYRVHVVLYPRITTMGV